MTKVKTNIETSMANPFLLSFDALKTAVILILLQVDHILQLQQDLQPRGSSEFLQLIIVKPFKTRVCQLDQRQLSSQENQDLTVPMLNNLVPSFSYSMLHIKFALLGNLKDFLLSQFPIRKNCDSVSCIITEVSDLILI